MFRMVLHGASPLYKYNRDCNETQSTSTVANYEREVRSAVNLLPKQWQDDTLLNPGGGGTQVQRGAAPALRFSR